MQNSESIMLSISSKKDLEKLRNNKQIKYINLDITNCDFEVIEYFKNNGHNYYYSELINNKCGYIYVNYETFLQAENIIDNLFLEMDSNFNELEKTRYLYIKLGKILSYDINIYPEKNEINNYINIGILNNIWGALANHKATNISLTKIYYYLCRLLKIDNEIIMMNEHNYLGNKLDIDNNKMIIDLTKDIPFIQANFQTRGFASYNSDRQLDRKIGYIKNDYSDKKLDNILDKINFSNNNFLKDILLRTQDLINVSSIKPVELGIIYQIIFEKYCPNYNIKINNLYVNDIYANKEHFILISYLDDYYSYNFKKNSFVNVTPEQLEKNLKMKKIGLYLNEDLPCFSLTKKGVM